MKNYYNASHFLKAWKSSLIKSMYQYDHITNRRGSLSFHENAILTEKIEVMESEGVEMQVAGFNFKKELNQLENILNEYYSKDNFLSVEILHDAIKFNIIISVNDKIMFFIFSKKIDKIVKSIRHMLNKIKKMNNLFYSEYDFKFNDAIHTGQHKDFCFLMFNPEKVKLKYSESEENFYLINTDEETLYIGTYIGVLLYEELRNMPDDDVIKLTGDEYILLLRITRPDIYIDWGDNNG